MTSLRIIQHAAALLLAFHTMYASCTTQQTHADIYTTHRTGGAQRLKPDAEQKFNLRRNVGCAAGTLVATSAGMKPIESLKAGDLILSFNFTTNTFEFTPIITLRCREITRSIIMEIDEQIIHIGAEHHLYTHNPDPQWTRAELLTPNCSAVQTLLGSGQIAHKTRLHQPIHMYDISLGRNHNFFITHTFVLVHNFLQALIMPAVTYLVENVTFSVSVELIGGLVIGSQLAKNEKPSVFVEAFGSKRYSTADIERENKEREERVADFQKNQFYALDVNTDQYTSLIAYANIVQQEANGTNNTQPSESTTNPPECNAQFLYLNQPTNTTTTNAPTNPPDTSADARNRENKKPSQEKKDEKTQQNTNNNQPPNNNPKKDDPKGPKYENKKDSSNRNNRQDAENQKKEAERRELSEKSTQQENRKDRPKPLTNEEAREQAKKWGYEESKNPPFNSQGELTFKKGNKWISPDNTGHGGGVWKYFEGRKRTATLDANGNYIKG